MFYLNHLRSGYKVLSKMTHEVSQTITPKVLAKISPEIAHKMSPKMPYSASQIISLKLSSKKLLKASISPKLLSKLLPKIAHGISPKALLGTSHIVLPKTPFRALGVSIVGVFLTSCTYNGLSGSSGLVCPADVTGLWVQAENVNAPGTDQNENNGCACRNLGEANGAPRPCFHYYDGERFIGGYIDVGIEVCNGPMSPADMLNSESFSAQRDAVFDRLDMSTQVGSAVIFFGENTLIGAVGQCSTLREEQNLDLSVGGSVPGARHIDIIHVSLAASGSGRERICFAHYFDEGPTNGESDDVLYLGTDLSRGISTAPQPANPAACDAVRYGATDIDPFSNGRATRYERVFRNTQ